jgi:hypothetical protein
MRSRMEFDQEEGAVSAVREEATPARITTTLYELMATLQDAAGPDNDSLVVATMVRLLRSGRLTFPDQARAPLYQSRHELRAQQYGFPRATQECSRA